MKRLFYICSTLALLVGCTKSEEFDEPNYGGNTEGNQLTSIYAGVADADSRTYVENDTDILWHNGDALSLFNTNYRNAEFAYEGEDGAQMARFDLVSGTSVDTNESMTQLRTHALYPYDANATSAYDEASQSFAISTTYPATQSYAPNSFGRGANLMVAASNSDSQDAPLYFRNACGYFTVKLYGEGVKVRSITLKTRGVEKLSGAATICTHATQAPVVTMAADASTAVTLDCGEEGVALGADAENATEFWFALPPTTFEQGLMIEVTSTNSQRFTQEVTKQIVVERNKIQPMAALKFVKELANNVLYYTLNSDSTSKFDWGTGQTLFDASIVSHTYDAENKRFVVTFLGTLRTIKTDAFDEVSLLKTIILPGSVTTIGDNAFRNCINLTSVELQGSVKSIGAYAFAKCQSLESITIPASVETIGEDAFSDCAKLKSVRIEDAETPLKMGVLHDGYYIETKRGPFYDSPLQNIYMGRDIECLSNGAPFTPDTTDEGAFAHKYANTEGLVVKAAIGPKVTKINEHMFNGLPMNSINIPEGVTSIGTQAFRSCTALASLSIPASVESIGDAAFYQCSSLKSVRIEDAATTLNLGISDYGLVNEVRYGAFYDSPLQNIYVGRNIQAMREGTPFAPYYWQEGAFANHYDDENAVAKVAVGPKVTSIPTSMFARLPITEINIPTGVTRINHNAFIDCDKLTRIDIPASVQAIGADAFYGCESLRSVYIEDSATPLTLGCSLEGSYRYSPFYDSPLTNIYCGRDIQQVTEIYEPLTETDWKMGIFANKFYNDESITTSVTLGPKVTTINRYMFNYLRINSINIPDGVTSIGHNAFKGCELLTGISIPGTVETIGWDAFCGCSSLKTLRIEDGDMPLAIGCAYGSIFGTDELGPFYYSPLERVYLGRDINFQKHDGTALTPNEHEEGFFANKHDKLTSINLGGKLTKILPYMFADTEATGVWIPHIVTSIGDDAFYNCDNLLTVTMGYDGTTQFPTIGEDVFSGCSNTVKIKVREEVYNNFLKHANEGNYGWGNYGSRIITGPFN